MLRTDLLSKLVEYEHWIESTASSWRGVVLREPSKNLRSNTLVAPAKAAQKFADRGDSLLAQPGILFRVVWRGEK